MGGGGGGGPARAGVGRIAPGLVPVNLRARGARPTRRSIEEFITSAGGALTTAQRRRLRRLAV